MKIKPASIKINKAEMFLRQSDLAQTMSNSISPLAKELGKASKATKKLSNHLKYALKPLQNLEKINIELPRLQNLSIPILNIKFPTDKFSKRLKKVERFIKETKNNNWVPHTILWKYLDEEHDFSDCPQTENHLRENWKSIRGHLSKRLPRAIAEQHRIVTHRQILNAHRAKGYIAVCRAVFPEIEGLAREFCLEDNNFKRHLDNHPSKSQGHKLRKKIADLFKEKESPIMQVSVAAVGGIIGYYALKTLQDETFADFELALTPAPLKTHPRNRHYNAHGLPYAATFQDSWNALMLLDTAYQIFGELKALEI